MGNHRIGLAAADIYRLAMVQSAHCQINITQLYSAAECLSRMLSLRQMAAGPLSGETFPTAGMPTAAFTSAHCTSG